MNLSKVNDTKKKDKSNNTISVKLEHPLSTGLMLVIGIGLGGALLQLITMALSVLFITIQRYLGG
jgi:hypothetical protein